MAVVMAEAMATATTIIVEITTITTVEMIIIVATIIIVIITIVMKARTELTKVSTALMRASIDRNSHTQHPMAACMVGVSMAVAATVVVAGVRILKH
jgi:hypothetical protein